MLSADPIETLEHDHAQCSNLVLALDRQVEMSRRKPLAREQLTVLMEQLRDALFTHCAREEEGLFPFIVRHLPDARRTVERLIAAHDALCGSLSRLPLLTCRAGDEAVALDEPLQRFHSV